MSFFEDLAKNVPEQPESEKKNLITQSNVDALFAGESSPDELVDTNDAVLGDLHNTFLTGTELARPTVMTTERSKSDGSTGPETEQICFELEQTVEGNKHLLQFAKRVINQRVFEIEGSVCMFSDTGKQALLHFEINAIAEEKYFPLKFSRITQQLLDAFVVEGAFALENTLKEIGTNNNDFAVRCLPGEFDGRNNALFASGLLSYEAKWVSVDGPNTFSEEMYEINECHLGEPPVFRIAGILCAMNRQIALQRQEDHSVCFFFDRDEHLEDQERMFLPNFCEIYKHGSGVRVVFYSDPNRSLKKQNTLRVQLEDEGEVSGDEMVDVQVKKIEFFGSRRHFFFREHISCRLKHNQLEANLLRVDDAVFESLFSVLHQSNASAGGAQLFRNSGFAELFSSFSPKPSFLTKIRDLCVWKRG